MSEQSPACTVPYRHGPHTIDNGKIQVQCKGAGE